MSEATTIRFKWFWHDQDVEQEQWLRQMAQQGWHLRAVSAFIWRFAQGAPADMVYRVDYQQRALAPDHLQLLADAGWEHATSSAGWHYWRIAPVDGRAPELFTDQASRRGKFARLLPILLVTTIPTLLFVAHPSNRRLFMEELSWPFKLFLAGGMLLIVHGVVRLSLRLYRMRQPS